MSRPPTEFLCLSNSAAPYRGTWQLFHHAEGDFVATHTTFRTAATGIGCALCHGWGVHTHDDRYALLWQGSAAELVLG
jgi:hypothetical protein